MRTSLATLLLAGLTLAISACSGTPAQADPVPEKLTVATWNLEWFYDNYDGDNYAQLAKEQKAPSRADWDWKLIGVAEAIAEMQPTILCLQEIENQRVLFYLTSRLKKDFGLDYRIAFLEGTDYFTEQDVGILYRSGLVSFTRREQSQEMIESKQYYNLTKQIFADFEWGPPEDRERLTIANVHFRAAPQQTEVRKRQARLLKYWLAEQIARGDNVMLLGDFNTNDVLPHTDPNGDIAVLLGMDTPETSDDLIDLLATIPRQPQFTHMIGRQFDRILVTPGLMNDDPKRTDLVFRKAEVRNNLVVRGKQQDKDHMDIFWKIPEAERDLSDHYPLVAEFEFAGKKK